MPNLYQLNYSVTVPQGEVTITNKDFTTDNIATVIQLGHGAEVYVRNDDAVICLGLKNEAGSKVITSNYKISANFNQDTKTLIVSIEK